ncbi:MAG: DUF92 domain-containing protein [Treponema sp.]|nr:DUF92 domain-containing protein [Treponema sp.]
MTDLVHLAETFVFIFAFIGLATLLLRLRILGPAMTRKVVHIGVAHWWLLYMAFIVSPIAGMAGALVFVVVNSLSYRLQVFRATEDPSPGRNLGTIWFPISLSVLIGLEMLGLVTRWQAGVGVLVMGWGDGMAAVVGQAFSKRPVIVFGSKKSAVGTSAFVAFSFVATAIMTGIFVPGLSAWDIALRAGSTAMFAAWVELATPFGVDNLSVPILTTLFYVFIASGPLAGPFAAALALNAVVGIGAWKKEAVDASGAVVGAAVGTVILTAAGIAAYGLLAGFFVSSTALGRIAGKRRGPSQVEEKGSRRDAFQVLANAGAAATASVLYGLTGDSLWLAAFATSFAAANADTWASELGVLYRKLPRSILTGKEVPAGASGGVTPLGFLASALGAAFIGLLFAASYASLADARIEWGLIALIASLGGFAGSVIDSLLGAAFQAQYRCVVTGLYTERPSTDGKPNMLTRGMAWFTNDVVNFASTAAVTIVAAGVYAVLR